MSTEGRSGAGEPAERGEAEAMRPGDPEAEADVRPGGPEAPPINAGVPASMPPGMARWASPPGGRSPYTDYPRSTSPTWAPPDPAAVSGPPWPRLVASSPYQPPHLIRWPVVVALLAVAALIGALIAITAGGSSAHPGSLGWLATHEATIRQLNHDQTTLAADRPTGSSTTSRWAADWQTFHADAVSAASIPNPGGAATVPWREMLNDYATGSATYLQALATREQADLLMAQRELDAGDQAARRFNLAMDLPSS